MKRSSIEDTTTTQQDHSPLSPPPQAPSPKKVKREEFEGKEEEKAVNQSDFKKESEASKEAQSRAQKPDASEVNELLTRLIAIFEDPSIAPKKFSKACEACKKAVDQGLIKGPQSALWFKLLCTASDRFHGHSLDQAMDGGWQTLVGAATSFKAMEAGSMWDDKQREHLDSWFFEMNILRSFEESDDAISFGKPAGEVRDYVKRFADAVSAAMVTSSNNGLAKDERDSNIAKATPPTHFTQVLFHVLDAVSAMSISPERLLWARTPSVQLLQFVIDKGSVMWNPEQSRRLEEFKARVSDTNSGINARPGIGPSQNRFELSTSAWKQSESSRSKL